MKQTLFIIGLAVASLFTACKKNSPVIDTNSSNNNSSTGGTTIKTTLPQIMGITSGTIILAKMTDGTGVKASDGSYYNITFIGASNLLSGGFKLSGTGTVKIRLLNTGTISTAMIEKTPYISFANTKTQDPSLAAKLDTTGAMIELTGADMFNVYGTSRLIMPLCKNTQQYSGQISVTSEQSITIFNQSFIQDLFGQSTTPLTMNMIDLFIAPKN